MKQLAFIAFILSSITSSGQKLYMKSGEFVPSENVKSISDFSSWNSVQIGNKNYCIVQFSASTSAAERAIISQKTGIQFFDYLPTWAFLATVPKDIQVSNLSEYKVRSILPFEAKYKVAPKLLQRPFPTWMDKGNGRIEILVEIQNDINQLQAGFLLSENQINLIKWRSEKLCMIEIAATEIGTIAAFPWVKFVQTPSAPTVVENLTERTNHRVNAIDQAYVTGLHYDGTGVSVSVGDDGIIGPHIDFQGRVTNHSSSNGGSHADHVCGIIAGGGNFDPITSGNGRGSNLQIYSDYDNLTNANLDYASAGVRITSNSLGQGCNVGYDADAQASDYLINSEESLMSVHSSGNNGNGTCGNVAQGYFTITGGYKAGKNVITVGNVDNSDVLNPSSSKGPSEDGRIKPEVVAVGTNVYSTQPDNTYTDLTGTSMACPGVAGTLASLWQAYRDTHLGADPNSALMKGVLLNTADDIGNAGPDFQYGYGRVNARRAFNVINNNLFFIDSMDNGSAKDFYLNVPPNTKQIKVMLYWNDFEGNPVSAKALVNDLNLELQDPSGNSIKPWILNNAPNVAALSAVAVRGEDNLNNAEQITLNNPTTGLYILTVIGVDVPLGPQKFVLTYEIIEDSLTMIYPNGGESFVGGKTERIRWDAFGNTATFRLRYSDDGGATFNTIVNAVPANLRYYDWTPPATLNTGKMLIRVSRFGSVSDESDTLFSVFDVPKNLTIDTACANIFHLKWDAVASADGYKIYMMGPNSSGPNYMTQIGTSTTNEFVISSGVNLTDTFYFAVSAGLSTNGANGLRTIAYQKLPGTVNCVDDAYNMETILPFKDAYTCATVSPLPIKMKIKNNGLRPLANLGVHYQLNANPVVNEVMAGPVAIGDSIIYTFTTLANFALPGSYSVTTWTNVYTDINLANDTSSSSNNVSVATTITAPNVEDFEGPLFPPTGWRAIDADNNVKWQKTLCLVDPTGFNSHTAYMDFFNYTHLNEVDDLETVQYDLTGVASDSLFLTFDVSHAYGPATDKDSLEVLISEDCAATFTPTTYYKGGSVLATAGMMSTNYYSPTLSSQWRNDRINLTSYEGKKIFVRFRATNKNGNNLFIDNINMMLKDAWPLGTTSIGEDNVNVYPNPSDGNYTLELNSYSNKNIKYSIYNVAGQKLKESRLAVSSGKTRIALNISSMPSGMYFLELNDGTSTKKIKLSKY